MNMNTTETVIFTPGNLKSLVSVSSELRSLIASVKKIAAVTTLEEALTGLKMYIQKKQLFDPFNPLRISCQNDELASVFGVANFTLQDMKSILQTLIKPVDKCSVNSFPEAAKTISDISSAKRTLDENEESARKKKCSTSYSVCTCSKNSPMYLYIPTSPAQNDTSDSPESIQGYETAFVKDSTDEDIWSTVSESEFIIAKERVFDVEYDSGSSTDIDSESKSDETALSSTIITFMCRSDSDVEFWADSEEDAEISRSDLWECEDCKSLNKPLRRSCIRCWSERPNWLPENEKKFKKQKASRKRKRQRSILANNMRRSGHNSAISPQGSLSSSQETANSNATQNNVCIVCQEKPANALIVHSKFAHQVACYKCAKKLKKQKQRCPICRRTIDMVVYKVAAY